MTNKTETTARLHEHAGRVAIRIGEGKTAYLSCELARLLGMELQLAGIQIKNGYHYEPVEVEV